MAFYNPFTFRPGSVSVWTTAIYLAVLIPIIYVHEVVPPTPAEGSLRQGINLTEAWHDLQVITESYHPYNSHANDDVRQFLIDRSKEILDRNKIGYTSQEAGGFKWNDASHYVSADGLADSPASISRAPGATLFDDLVSNVSYTLNSGKTTGTGIGNTGFMGSYFEGNNFYVYIHGKDDPEGDWWAAQKSAEATRERGAGVMVNCHFDSVATAYGATDDGVSCVTMLQLLSYFTSEGRQPKNGIVLLFNNAEEDGLLGARAFAHSPLLPFIHTFVNLEGAGAGGRAVLFRTTDLQTAKAYSGSPHPFGSVVAANAFERGVIKSGTDYEVFAGVFGQRGLDIAFYAPRSRYHTQDDDARHTSTNSVWHMLSAALATTERLSETSGSTFSGDRSDGRRDLVQNGKTTEGVWFDWFGKAWAAFPLRGLFAWSLTLLVATPLVFVVVTFLLARKDKYYFFATDVKFGDEIGAEPVRIGGWKGFSRFPIALVFASGLTFASVLLVAKLNPLIVYSSSYAVWAMTISIFYFSFWLVMRGSSFVRPSALHRGFSIIWLFTLTWIVQIFVAVAEDRMHIGALYFVPFLHTSIFLALLISLLELFALPGKQAFASQMHDAEQEQDLAARHASIASRDGPSDANDRSTAEEEDDDTNETDTPTETTPLRAGEQGYGANQTTFASTYRRSVASAEDASPSVPSYPPYDHEQSWSGHLPTWTWAVQFLLLAPIHLILVGSLGLLQTSAMGNTGIDGSSLSAPLIGIGLLGIILLLPLTPFIHRVTHHIPTFLLLVLIGTFVYNIIAFPFSIDHRFKFNFQQIIDLDNSTNIVTLTGLEEYIRPVIDYLPNAAGQTIDCQPTPGRNLRDCTYDASSLIPRVADMELEDLITLTSSVSGDADVLVMVDAVNTRMCYLDFSRPVFGFSVQDGGNVDERFGSFPNEGLARLQLWRRKWSGSWNVSLSLGEFSHSMENDKPSTHTSTDSISNEELKARSTQSEPFDITVRCGWSDANEAKTIPAFTELLKYMPKWAVATKRSVALVEVKKTYKVLA